MDARVRRTSPGWALLLLLPLSSAVAAKEGDGIAGTYSSLKYSHESGDLSGYEIQIVPVTNGYRVVLQLAEGEVTDVVVADASIDESGRILASFPLRAGGSCRLRARLDGGKLVGVLSFDMSGDVELTVPRSSGYWDRP